MANRMDDFDLYSRKLPYFKRHFKVVPSARKYLLLENQEDYFDHKLYKNVITLRDLNAARNDEAFVFEMNEVLFHRRAFIDFHGAIFAEISVLNKH